MIEENNEKILKAFGVVSGIGLGFIISILVVSIIITK